MKPGTFTRMYVQLVFAVQLQYLMPHGKMALYLEQTYQDKSILSLKKAAEVTHNMYQIKYTLPASKHTENHLLKMDQEQQELYDIIQKNF